MLVPDAIRAIKERLSLADIARRYVDLKPNGTRLTAPCPFHQETKPSFSIDPEKGFFYCFGCQAAGDIFEFYGKINGLDFKDTLEQLAREAGISVEYGARGSRGASSPDSGARSRIMAMHEEAAKFYRAAFSAKDSEECRAYARKRGLSPEIIEKFGLGWAPRAWRVLAERLLGAGFERELAVESGLIGLSEGGVVYDRFRGRMMFPIKNLSGQTIAFGGRVIGGEDEAKYINSADTPIYKKKEHLYGLPQARRGMTAKGHAILTEGYVDVLTLHQFGYGNAVGVLGTALTPEQIKRLSGFVANVTLLFDGDGAGRKAALRSAQMFLARGLACKVVLLPEGEDIDSLLRSVGTEGFERLRGEALDGLNFCLRTAREKAPKEALDWARQFLASLELPELSGRYAAALARGLGIDEKALRENLSPPAKRGAASPTLAQIHNMRDLQIIIFAVRYPERLDDLREIGADLALTSQRAREYWNALEKWGSERVFYFLDEKQKRFWIKQRGPGAAPRNDGDRELACLRAELDAFYRAAQKASLTQALVQAGSRDFQTDLEYLRALQETLENGHEQS